MEIANELRGYIGDNPPTQEEVLRAQESQTLTLPGQWETNGAVEGSILDMVQYDLPEDYYDTYAEQVRALDVGQVSAAAKAVLHPDNLIWVVVGDVSVIETGIRELNLGDIHRLDPEGNVIE